MTIFFEAYFLNLMVLIARVALFLWPFFLIKKWLID